MKTADISVSIIDHMGSDLTVVNAARVSFQKHSSSFDGRDKKLVKYLAAHNHWSPFAHTSVQFYVKAPIFVARQLVKHQVGGVWNEVSRRYVNGEPEFFLPKTWRGKPVNAKQGSDGTVDWSVDDFAPDVDCPSSLCWEALKTYLRMLELGIAPEQARMILPQNVMTEWYWTGSLVFWARVCELRLDSHAQAETAEVAKLIDKACAKLFPHSWAALRGNIKEEDLK